MEDTRVAVKVWDLPVRLFHWVLVVLLLAQIVTGKIGGELMPVHVYCGYTVLVLVVFRILWGFAGSTHARFASFIAGPRATFRFAVRLFSRQAVPQVGHNPLGGWSVLLLVLSLALQAGSGLFANDGLETFGPLVKWVSLDTSNVLTEFHRLNFKILAVLSVLHILGVLFHWLVKKENLIGAMFTGVKDVPASAVRERRDALRKSPRRRAASREQAHAYFASNARALVLFILSVLLVGVALRGFH